jgi:hypothetical protein
VKFPVLASALSLLVAGSARAVPDVVTYAARVENDAGAFSGTVSATFQLFAARTGGTELWSENAASIVVIGGDMVHELGSVEPLDDAIIARDDLFLQVTMNGDVLEPRAAVRSVPFALRAKNAQQAARATGADSADRLGGQLPSSFQFTAGANGGLALAGTAFSIAPSGVTEDSIAAAAVSLAKLAANSVDASKLLDGAVTLAKLAANSVDGSKLVDAAVTLAKLAPLSVDGSKLVDGAVTLGKLAANSVDGSKLVDGVVSLVKLASNSVDSSKIVDGSVSGFDIQGGAISSAKIANGAVGTTQILDLSVASDDLASNAVSTTKIAANAVTADKINGTLIALFSRPSGCGGGLQVGAAACATLVCGETVLRDSFNTILDVDVSFMNCAGTCVGSNTTADSCTVTAAGSLLPTSF